MSHAMLSKLLLKGRFSSVSDVEEEEEEEEDPAAAAAVEIFEAVS